MNANFDFFENEIKKCLLLKDINYFIGDLKELFTDDSWRLMNDCDKQFKVDTFFREFKKLKTAHKYKLLKDSAERHNKWIYLFMSVNLTNPDDVCNIRAYRIVLDNLLDLLRAANHTMFVLDEEFCNILCHEEVVTFANRDYLIRCLEKDGGETAMFELFNVISARDSKWYGVILYLMARQKTSFMKVICDELNVDDCLTGQGKEAIMDYATNFIEKHITIYREEHPQTDDYYSDCGIDDMSWDEAASNAPTLKDLDDTDVDPELDINVWLSENIEAETKPSKLVMKQFQLELTELALQKKNVIIYAPTGIGKTIVAIYITNEHMRTNKDGKVAFLVPRRHLVTQQSDAFEKYKDHDLRIMEMRGRTDKYMGPLSGHLDNYDVFVMTGGIFYNALTVNDGNKLSSIAQFSLIIIDECHHCMKRSTYSRIMCEYIKEKQKTPQARLPQIVGLTASPRSNNADDTTTMRKSLLELCANLDCFNFAFVKKCVKDLEDEIIKPKEEVIRVVQRQSNQFEAALLSLMEQCENKLLKMRTERYFPAEAVKCIPTEKFNQNYVVFVGKLQCLNNVTIESNDGKQKVYAIYRYLNAYYRGLIVYQLFNEYYAKDIIDRYLFHDGKTFTCCYDEEFNNAYKSSICDLKKSNNPAIETIIGLIKEQFENNPNSRILIFVQQVDYTHYLVDLLLEIGNIYSHAIVGSHRKTDVNAVEFSKDNASELLEQFKIGEFKVLVATSVVEEGLDVPNCNMVISYGYVTNETALIQRLGRARSMDSRYVLILPPMFAWMEIKENNNRRRNEMMMNLIHEYDKLDINSQAMIDSIEMLQRRLFNLCNPVDCSSITNQQSWEFKCRSCQSLICTSEELRLLEISHVICINPDVINRLNFVRKDFKVYGLCEIKGSVVCTCMNHRVGKYMLFQKRPYLQLRIDRCIVSKNSQSVMFKKWKDFKKRYTIPFVSAIELERYLARVKDIDFELL